MNCQDNTFDIIQGNSFNATVRWEGAEYVYSPITAIGQSAPAPITSAGHGVPDGWRVAIVSVKGMDEINAKNNPPRDSDFETATRVDANSITLNGVNAADYCAYRSGGYIQYKEPVDMTNYTARMQFRASVDSEDVLDEFTDTDARLDDGTGIIIDNTEKTITILIAAEVTDEYTFNHAVFSLEMTSPEGVVTRILEGEVNCSLDITR